MTAPTTSSLLGAIALLAAGAALGFAHLALLRLNVRLYLQGTGGLGALALHLARALGVGAAFVLIAPQGAAALLLALAGFSGARVALIRHLT